MGMVSQADLGRLFGRTQQWVSKQQSRPHDPMPRDLAGAQEWGGRHGLLTTAGQPGPSSSMPARDEASIALQRAREEEIRLRIGEKAGDLMPRLDVEGLLIKQAADFRLVACEYPRKARSIIERHGIDPITVAAIYADLDGLAAELLNRADPGQNLRGRSRDDVRAILTAKMERVLECL